MILLFILISFWLAGMLGVVAICAMAKHGDQEFSPVQSPSVERRKHAERLVMAPARSRSAAHVAPRREARSAARS